MGFLRALEEGRHEDQQRLATVYPHMLRLVPESSHRNSQQLKDHIIELSQTSTFERIQELKEAKKNIPEYVYQQRKHHILSSLKKQLPGSD